MSVYAELPVSSFCAELTGNTDNRVRMFEAGVEEQKPKSCRVLVSCVLSFVAYVL